MDGIHINEAISQSTYLLERREEITNFFIKNFSQNKLAKCYLKRQSLYENIIVINYEMHIKFNDKLLPVFILIYFYNDFPYDEPDFYFENKPRLAINKNYIDIIVNRMDLRINSKVFYIWDYSTKNIKDFLVKIENAFKLTFPLARTENENNFIGNCDLKINECVPIIFSNENIKISLLETMISEAEHNDFFKDLFNLKKKVEKKENKNNNNYLFNYNDEINIEDIKQLIKKEIKDKCEKKVIPNILKVLKEKRTKFEEDENKIKNALEKQNKKELVKQFENAISSLNVLYNKYKIQENLLIEGNKKLEDENETKITLDNLKNYFIVENENILNLNAIQECENEYLLILRKAYEKKIISFEYIKDEIYNISNEIFKIKYLLNKDNFDI